MIPVLWLTTILRFYYLHVLPKPENYIPYTPSLPKVAAILKRDDEA